MDACCNSIHSDVRKYTHIYLWISGIEKHLFLTNKQLVIRIIELLMFIKTVNPK